VPKQIKPLRFGGPRIARIKSLLTSAHEQSRYETALRALSRERYGSAYEPGCSAGAFTVKLAEDRRAGHCNRRGTECRTAGEGALRSVAQCHDLL
jgi:hypothetical protein